MSSSLLTLRRLPPSRLLLSHPPTCPPHLYLQLRSIATPPSDPHRPIRASPDFLSSLNDPALRKLKPAPAPLQAEREYPDDWKTYKLPLRAVKRVVWWCGIPMYKIPKENYRSWYIKVYISLVISACLAFSYGFQTWEKLAGMEPEHTDQVYTTKVRLPKRDDPDHVREDKWKVVTRKRAEFLIKRRESTQSYDRPGNPVKQCDTSALQANERMEDRSAEKILAGPDGDLCFFAVFDGHSGHKTSEFVSKTLLPTVALSLATLHSGSLDSPFEPEKIRTAKSILGRTKEWLFDADGFAGKKQAVAVSEWKSPDKVEVALQRAFEALDKTIVWDPVERLQTVATQPKDDEETVGSNLASILPALSGSCALLAYLDTEAEDLYVALAGDCRAVAGYWMEEQQKWRVDVLSDDQTGRNPKELARIRSEHPESERDNVVRRGRILGGLEPSRAFGDARYKWPAELQPQLYDGLLPSGHKRPRNPSPQLLTPPYVTARPEVTHRKLNSTANPAEGELKFLVMATDGLFDRLSNEAIVGLVGERINQPYLTGLIAKDDIMAHVMHDDATAGGFDGKRKMKKKDEEQEHFWYGMDDNAATFLIRNSLAGGDQESFVRLMSVQPPVSRYQRDDTTVKVIFFGAPPPPVDRLPEVQWPAAGERAIQRSAIAIAIQGPTQFSNPRAD